MEKKINMSETIMASLIFFSTFIGYEVTILIVILAWILMNTPNIRDVIRITLAIMLIIAVINGIWGIWYNIFDLFGETVGNNLFVFTQKVNRIIHIGIQIIWFILGVSELLGKKFRVEVLERWNGSNNFEFEKKCPHCKAEISKEMMFCMNCGNKLK